MSKEEFLQADGWELKAYQEAFEAEEEKRDRRFAMIAMILANVNRDSKKKKKPYEISDFMPKKPVSSEQLSEKVESFRNYLRTIHGS